MLILIDTSAFIEFLNRTGSVFDREITRLIEEDTEDIALANLTVTEVLQGIRDDGRFQITRDALLTFTILAPRGVESYVAAAELYRECRRQGLTVRSTIDLVIAQIALENDAVLLHNDRDFGAIGTACGLRTYLLASTPEA